MLKKECHDFKNGDCGLDGDKCHLRRRGSCYKHQQNPETPQADVALNDLLGGLVELKPQITSKEHGPEPSIRELVHYYYRHKYCEGCPELTEQYLKELFNMAT